MAQLVVGSDREMSVPVLFGEKSRAQGFYILGKAGFGKTTLMTNMVRQDMAAGHGMLVLDPHGTFVENVLARVPESRVDDVILIEIGDETAPFAVNAFSLPEEDPAIRIQYASHVTDALRKAFGNYPWGIQLQTIISMSLSVLLHYPRLHIGVLQRFLTDPIYRKTLLAGIENEDVLGWWAYFEHLTPILKQEYLRVPVSRLPLIFTDPTLKRILCQPQSTLHFPTVIAKRQIVLVRFPELMPPASVSLLGTLLIGQLLAAAVAREDVTTPFMVYVDEYDRFDTEDYGTILDKLRYKNICLTFAHQHRGQLTEERRNFPLAAGNLCCFQLVGTDAERLSVEFSRDPTPPEMISRPITQPVYKTWEEEYWEDPEDEERAIRIGEQLAALTEEEERLAKIEEAALANPAIYAWSDDPWSRGLQPILGYDDPRSWVRVPPKAVLDEALRRQGVWMPWRSRFRGMDIHRQTIFGIWIKTGTSIDDMPEQVWGLPPGRVSFRFSADHETRLAHHLTIYRDPTGVVADFIAFLAPLTRHLHAQREYWFCHRTNYPYCPDPAWTHEVDRWVEKVGGFTTAHTALERWFENGAWEVTPIAEGAQVKAWVEAREEQHRQERARLEQLLPVKKRVEHRDYLYDLPVQDMVAGGGRDGHAVTRMEKVPAPARPIADIQREVGSRLVSYPILVCRVRLVGETEMDEHEVRIVHENIVANPERIARIRDASRRRLTALMRADDGDEGDDSASGEGSRDLDDGARGDMGAFHDDSAVTGANVPRRTKRRRWVTPPPESP